MNLSVLPPPDPETDQTAAIQSIIDQCQLEHYVGGGTVELQGWHRITDTLRIEGSAVTLQGSSGWGEPGAPNASGLVWDGPAGAPMVDFVDCNGGGVRRLGFGGNDDRPPIAIRHYYGNNGPGQSQSIFHSELKVGGFQRASGQIAEGLRIEGVADMDRFALQNSELYVTDVGVNVLNHQATWSQISNVLIVGAQTGVAAGSDLQLLNINFNRCALMFHVSSGYNVQGLFVGSEGCQRVATLGTNSQFVLRGGYIQTKRFVSGPVIEGMTGGTGTVKLEDVDFRNTLAAYGSTIKLGTLNPTGRLSIDNCKGVNLTDVDLSAITGAGRLWVDFVGDSDRFSRQVDASDVLPDAK